MNPNRVNAKALNLDKFIAETERQYAEASRMWEVIADIRDKRLKFEAECHKAFEGL